MSTPTLEPLLYPIPQASILLNRSVFSVRRMIWDGQLEAVQYKENGKLYIKRESLLKCIEENKIST